MTGNLAQTIYALSFYGLAFLAVLAAIVVISARNAVISAIWLVVCFVAVAGIYVLLKAPFLAMVQILVYAGAIMVLFVMVIMLLNLDEEVRQRRKLGLLAALSVLAGLGVGVLILLMTWKPATQSLVPKTLDPLTFGTTETVGRYLFTTYLLPFEAASVLLLAAIVGAIVLSRRSEHKPGEGGDR